MTGKRVLLTLNPEMYTILEEKAKANFMTVQELITEAVRKNMLAQPAKKEKTTAR